MKKLVRMSTSLFLILSWCTFALANPHGMPTKLKPDGFKAKLSQSNETYIAGQPTLNAIKRLKRAGITAVINLRTPGEMKNKKEVDYNEKREVEALGLDYVHIPMGGRKPYSEKMLDEFITAYDKHDGKVLLHCRSAHRASQIWVAFLIKHEGLDLSTAQTYAKAINLGSSPIEGLLGKKLEWQLQK